MERIVVAGAGTMGAGLAFVAASAGFSVDLIDPDESARSRAKERLAKAAQRAGRAAPANVNYYDRVPVGVDAVLAIEAVPERLELKRSIFDIFASTLPSTTLLATNTSSLSVSDIGEGVARPERVLGLHFFNPPEAMRLVEVVRGAHTSEETLERGRAFVERFGKVAVTTADTPGFIVNRVARPYYLQALRAYGSQTASMETIDAIARGAGFRMGPFELMDFIGLDVNLATSESLYERTGEKRFAPVELQRTLVARRQLGRKTGSGFYAYAGASTADAPKPLTRSIAGSGERVTIVGSSAVGAELAQMLGERVENVILCENEEMTDEIPLDTTIAIDVGAGSEDRGSVLAELDKLLDPEAIILADAYATDVTAAARRMILPERLVGYGVLGAIDAQSVVEIVPAEASSGDAVDVAQEVFETIDKRVELVQDKAGLVLGRIVGSIVNEAVIAAAEGVASADDIDLAMRLGTNYPRGPLAWGKEIGGDRIVRILQRLAGAEGAAFAPHRALWALDAPESVPADA